MADYGQGAPPPPPMTGMHSGRIPSFKNTHGENFQNRCGPEPPACVQNAMMTKDKKPFTYTPGGLDLSQIRTPSMARRLNRAQQEQSDLENPAYFRQPGHNGVPGPPPPPPPGPPPPPPLVISVNKPPSTVKEGERPEIVIPENPIGMLRKTHSPYHWESEMSDRLQEGSVPKFVDKKSPAASPALPQMQKRQPPPQQFSQQPPMASPPAQASSNYPQYSPQQQQNKAESPIWKPEPKYPGNQFNNNNSSNASPHMQMQSPMSPVQDSLQRQDSQFNLSPSPWGKESPFPNSSNSSNRQGFSPSIESPSSKSSTTPVSSAASPWKQENRNSPMRNSPMSPNNQDYRNSPMSPNNQDYRNSPLQVETRASPMPQPKSPMSPMGRIPVQQQSPQPGFNNMQRQQNNEELQQQNAAPWRQAQQNSPNVQVMRGPPQANNNARPNYVKSPSPPQQNYQNSPESPNEVRYQSHMTIPVTPRKPQQTPNTPIQEPFYARPVESPKDNMPWVRGENVANKSVPPPPWAQKAAESRKSLPRENPPSSSGPLPPWVQAENSGSQTLPRTQQNKVQPPPCVPEQLIQHTDGSARVIPIQMEVGKNELKQNQTQMRGNQGMQTRNQQQPQLRIIIDMNQQPGQQNAQANQGAQQHIMKVIQPQLMRMDQAGNGPSPVQQQQVPAQQNSQPRTRIIPIQMEPSSPVVTSPRVIYHKVNFEGPPRQSRAFRVLQTITGTQEADDVQDMENQGYSDL